MLKLIDALERSTWISRKALDRWTDNANSRVASRLKIQKTFQLQYEALKLMSRVGLRQLMISVDCRDQKSDFRLADVNFRDF